MYAGAVVMSWDQASEWLERELSGFGPFTSQGYSLSEEHWTNHQHQVTAVLHAVNDDEHAFLPPYWSIASRLSQRPFAAFDR
ncbi:hypothetical protein WAI453_001967 [Rhynchosporium graminicola]